MAHSAQRDGFVRFGLPLAWAVKLAAAMAGVLLLWPVVVRAQFNIATTNGTVTITGYTGSDAAVTIPSSTNSLPVTRLGTQAFLTNSTLTSVTVPSSITNYGVEAFDNCSNLLAVYCGGNARVDSFPAAPPVFLKVPNVTLYYLQGTTGWHSTVDQLPAVQWDPQVLGQLIYTNLGGQITITGYTGPGGMVTIPSTINGVAVGTIGSNAFFNSVGLSGINIPNTVTNVGDAAFAGCAGLKSITIPKGVAGSGVFSNCTGLTNVIISSNVTSITADEFFGCTGMANVTISGSVSNIGSGAFAGCSNLTAIYYQGNPPMADATIFNGDNVATNYYLPKISGWGASFAGRPTAPVLFTFSTNGSAITINSYIGIDGSVTIPDTINGLPVTTLGNVTFNACVTLTNVTISKNVTGIAGQAFVGCPNLLTITVNALNPVFSSVGGVLFDKSQATLIYYPAGRGGSYHIPAGVTRVGTYSFQGCGNVTSVTVPGSVTSLGGLVFNACPKLTSVYFLGNEPSSDFTLFYNEGVVTVYYLPGTTGWDTNLEGEPTVLWDAQLQGGGGTFGVRTNQFGFNITGGSNLVVVVAACTDLANPLWSPLQTNTLTGDAIYFGDAQWTNYPARFYRLITP